MILSGEDPIHMYVVKRNGNREPADVTKIVKAVERHQDGLSNTEALRVATKTINGLYDGATTDELDRLSIQTAAMLIGEEPEYSRLAGRLLANYIAKEVEHQDIQSFSQSIKVGWENSIISNETFNFVQLNKHKLNSAVEPARDTLFEYFGLRTVYDRYLLRHPHSRAVTETPQYFFMRVACGLANTVQEAVELYMLISSLKYMMSTPTLFNSGTRHPQMSSCYLLESPDDSIEGIYAKYGEIAQLSKFAGGIGSSWSRIRSTGSLIRGTNGTSNGVVPWLKTLDSSVAAVNQGGKRKGAAAVYLESWHADIEEFLELRDNTGDQARRTHNLNLANWVPDLFMRRVKNDWNWSLFDPKQVPQLIDLWGTKFEAAYEEAEKAGLAQKVVKARDLYARMMRTLAQTGNGWMCFKDTSNSKANQVVHNEHDVIHLSNLCTEILEVTNNEETAVCNLGSLNLGAFVVGGKWDLDALMATTKVAVKFLDRVVDRNFYPVHSAAASNARWRPVGLGVMGLQDALFRMDLPFGSPGAIEATRMAQEAIYYAALSASSDLAKQSKPCYSYNETATALGKLQMDLWGVSTSTSSLDWEGLRSRIKETGLRNSLLIAIAPTATIASICGVGECIEPQVSNLFKRETLSGEFLQINNYLVDDLKALDIWNSKTRDAIKAANGSVQHVEGLPDTLKLKYRTAWEIPQKDVIEMAVARGPYIDQSQSLNLFVENPSIGKLSSMYMYAWERGLKTTYYLRSRPATSIQKTTISIEPSLNEYTEQQAVACSLENPEACEVCQ